MFSTSLYIFQTFSAIVMINFNIKTNTINKVKILKCQAEKAQQ